MTQNALVTAINADGTAEVTLLRESACSSCSGRHVCGGARKAVTTASNTVGAQVGDTVEVEARSSGVLAYAALVFLAPVLLALVLYYALSFFDPIAATVGAVVGFIAPFAVARVLSSRYAVSARPCITKVLEHTSETPPCDDVQA